MQRIQYPRRSQRIGFALAALFALTTLPIAASAACVTQSGEAPPMLSYAGNYVGDTNLLAAPAVVASLERLPTKIRQHFERNLDVAGPIDLIGCHLVLSGSAPHMGPDENAIVDVNLYSGAVTVAIHSLGRIDIYLDTDPAPGMPGGVYDAVPGAVKRWAVLADMGFPYQQPRSVYVHAPPH